MSDLIERQAVRQMLAEFLTGPQFLALDKRTCAIPAATSTGTQPSIDWLHVAPDYNWLARDDSGSLWLYRAKPEIHCGFWQSTKSHYCRAVSHASYTPGTCDWRDSLVMRPGHVEAGE